MSRRTVLIGGSIVAFLALLWAGGWYFVGGGVPRNTTVFAIDVGGKSRVEIAQFIANEGKKLAQSKTIIEVDGRDFKRKPTELGIFLDQVATVNQIQGRNWNPIDIFATLTTGISYNPVYTFSQSALTHALTDISKATERAAIEADIIYSGTQPVVINGADGRSIDVAKSAQLVRQQWLSGKKIILKTTLSSPQIATSVAKKALPLAVAAVSEPITLVVDGHSIKLKRSDIAYSLTFIDSGDGNLSPSFSHELLTQALGLQWTKWVTPPKNASFTLMNGVPRLQPSAPGRGISDEDLTRALVPVLALAGDGRSVVISTSVVEPKITTEMAGGLGITEVISTFTTKYPPAAYRIQNIHRAADLIDGTVIKPGEVFSLNKVVGERTAANGFAEGIVIYQGRFEKDFGGGVSQVATTTWNAAWFGGLDLVAHMAHSFYISRYPAGRESTVAWPNVDLKFRNNFETPIMIDTSYTNSTLTVSIYGKKKFDVETIAGPYRKVVDFDILDDDSPTCIHQDGVQGFDITVTRVLKLGGAEVKRESFNTHYIPEDRITCTNPEAVFGNPPVKPTPKPNPTPTPSATPTASSSPSATPTQSPTATAIPGQS